METLFVRLKQHDPRRGHVLRRFVYQGIKIHAERGWYRVEKPVAEYLRTVRQVSGDAYSPLAFDVCTEEEAKAIDTREETEARIKRTASDDVKLSPARNDANTVTSADVSPKTAAREEGKQKEKKS